MKPAGGASSRNESFTPKLFIALRDYNSAKFIADLIAGVTLGFIALPLALAFAISSGVPPQSGIYCAVIAGFLISALGGSMNQIAGPTGAFVVVIAGIVQKHGIDGMFMAGIMAGFLLIIMGLTGLGSAVKYIPRPVVIGFTNGIAVIIASTQIKDFFGLQIDKVPSDFLGRMESIFGHWSTLSVQATALSVGSLVLIILAARFLKKVPGIIIALLAGTVAAVVLRLPVETIATRFGGIPAGFPHLKVPTFHVDLIGPLMAPVLTVTMLGAIESLLSAVVADRMSGDRHNPNVELFAQGVGNVISPLFGGLPATGAVARTATNIRVGAKTPVAGMIHALTLLAILLFATPLANHIPLAVLAAILMVVAYNMGEWREIPEILRLSTADISVWLITFLLTVFADLTVAVEAGMILAALLYIRKVTNTTTVERVTKEYIEEGISHSLQMQGLPDGVAIFRIQGPFLFGSTDKLQPVEDQVDDLPQVVLLRLRNMTAIDATGVQALEKLAQKLHTAGKTLVICGMRDQPAKLLGQARFHQRLGDENIQPSLSQAVVRAKQILSESGP